MANLNLAKKIEIETSSGIWKTDFDEQLLFEENLTKKTIPNESQLALAKKLQSKLKDIFKQKYYAIIDFDGDSMGKLLSGSIEKVKANIDLKAFHKDLSSRLAAFAKEATKIVDTYGQTVYAGGDDFLGFLNLNHLFEAMKNLRKKFKEMVNDELLNYLNTEISFSAGVCIAHYKEPLSMVLSKAGAAQKTAKNDDKGKRDAFCIVASKHSGENHETYFNWGTACKNVSDLETVVDELIKPKRFSNTFIKNLNIEFARLTDTKGKLSVSRDLLEEEVKRLLKRSFMGKKEEKKKESEDFAKVIMAIYDHADTGHADGFDNFISALNICDFMHRLLNPDDEKVIRTPQLEIA